MQSPNALRPESIASQLSTNTDDIADLVAEALTFLKLDGSRVMNGTFDLNGNYIDNVFGFIGKYGVVQHFITSAYGQWDFIVNIPPNRTVASFYRDVNEAFFALYYPIAPILPVADPADGKSKLWMDANRFVKVGT
jgi:hypothetical protein